MAARGKKIVKAKAKASGLKAGQVRAEQIRADEAQHLNEYV